MESVRESMIAGNEVFLRGFGSFIIKQRAEKKARNISKNTTIVIPAHSVPAFKPAKTFLDGKHSINSPFHSKNVILLL